MTNNPESLLDTAAIIGAAAIAFIYTSSIVIDTSRKFTTCLSETITAPDPRVSRTNRADVNNTLRKISLGMTVDEIELAIINDMRTQRRNFNNALDSCTRHVMGGPKNAPSIS